jgi:membrane associated rhomboid family serine protease
VTQSALLLVGVAVVAGYLLRLALRLAPPASEFPLKTLLASLLSAAVAFAEVLPYDVGDSLRAFTLVVGPVYAFGPLLAIGLARVGRYTPAEALVALLYWTADGRSGPRRLLAQVALQRGDVPAALRLIPEQDALMLAQAHALSESWQELLELELPRSGDNAFLGDEARVEALLALGRSREAERVIASMRARWEAGPQGPLGYRSLRLSEARLAAEHGDLAGLRELLVQPLVGVAAHRMMAVLARGAERAGRPDEAAHLYRQAFTAAPVPLRPRYAARLAELGAGVPLEVGEPARPLATYGLAAALVLAFLGQSLLDASVGPFGAGGQGIRASALAAAFLVELPGLPAADAWWRYLSYALVHGNLLHIGFNVWVLVDLGRIFEARRGRRGLISAFVLGTATGAFVTAAVQTGSPLVLVGASGGVLGIAGALLADAWASRTSADRTLATGLLRWMGLIVLMSLAIPNVSLWGHVGGVLGGLLWGFLRQGVGDREALLSFAAAASLALLLVALARAILLALRLATL